MVKVGMVGLGGMGKAIAINIAKAGFEFTVADLREEPLKELKENGASIADSPRDVAAAAAGVAVSDVMPTLETMQSPDFDAEAHNKAMREYDAKKASGN